jgi:hypothetical protein
MSNPHLAVYLNDHLAGATGAVELLGQLATDSGVGKAAHRLLADVTSDREELLNLMRRLEITESATRKAGGWLGEKLAELKVRIDDPSDGKLRVLELLEVIALGIEGKRALWTALTAASETSPELRALDYGRLLRRVDEQRYLVEGQRLAAAKSALAVLQNAAG